MKKHSILKFTLTHMNAIIVEIWESFKLTSTSITKHAFKKTPLLPLLAPDQDMNI